MIMLTVTKPRRKLKRLLKGGALLLLLGVVVPGIYHGLQTVGAMSLFASGESVQTEVGAPAEQTEETQPPAQSAPPEQSQGSEQNAVAPLEEQAGAMQTEDAGKDEAGENTEKSQSAESVGSLNNTENTENAANAANADSAENTENAENAENAAADKPGLLDRLKAVIFGEPATVQPY